MVDMKIEYAGLSFKNPIVPASGTFGFGQEFRAFYDINHLGGISVKGTTLAERFGNATPRIADCTEGMLNAVGLQNPGVAHVCAEELPALRACYDGRIIANISGFSLDEYEKCAAYMQAAAEVDLIEVNVSCPNVKHGGLSFGTDARMAAEVTQRVKAQAGEKPVVVKLSPNVTDLVSIAQACEDAGADGLTLINTLLGMRFDLRKRRPILANGTGGFSGPAILPVALRCVYQVSKAVKIPIMGCGGVSCARDAVEMLMAGATLVQVGSANLVDPYACKNIVDELPQVMKSVGAEHLSDLVGAAH